MADIDDDIKALGHLQSALKEAILALNLQPESWDIASAVMRLQDSIGCLKCDIRWDQEETDVPEMPAITTAATETIKKILGEKAKEATPLQKFFWTI